ncbi:MAG: pyruvate formate lyase family protein [bacterium]
MQTTTNTATERGLRPLLTGLTTGLKTDLSILAFRSSLKAMALLFRVNPRFKREIANPETGFVFKAKFQFRTGDGKVNAYAVFADGRMRSGSGTVDHPDVTVTYRDKETLARLFSKSPEEALDGVLSNEMSYSGNLSYLMKFSYLASALRAFRGGNGADGRTRVVRSADPGKTEAARGLVNERLDRRVDEVRYLADPYLADYTLRHFPRLVQLKYRRYTLRPALCTERARLVTEFHRAHGFETDAAGRPRDPVLRQAEAVRHVLKNKAPRIQTGDLIAGTTTAKELGVPLYPEMVGLTIWPELRTVSERDLNPYDITPAEADVLNLEVFPFWMDRNIREHCRRVNGNPRSQQLDEHWVLYFMMKPNAISHTMPDFRMVLERGLAAEQARAAAQELAAATPEKRRFYRALQLALEGALSYAQHLSEEATRQAALADTPRRRDELLEIARICAKVPAQPAETVHEGVTSLWVAFCCLHQESANSALSIGRLDQLLNPLFLREMTAAAGDEERRQIIERTLELLGCLFVRSNDHAPMIPSVGNKLFGGTTSDDTITVGGVDRGGENAVCDMTYLVLKAAEMIGYQDPNLNARYHPGVNSEEYLRRLCEVNLNLKASPSIHNDEAMIAALVHQGIPLRDARDWAATGCVEPSIAGRHFGHTNCMFLNTVAPLELALHDGVHPLVGKQIGPHTGDIADPEAFPTFADFLAAYKEQLTYLADQSVEINNLFGESHQQIHPSPLLSAMTTGPLEKGLDVVSGGAIYNTSGVGLVSITDAVDSLLAIKRLVYDDGTLDFATLRAVLADDFSGAAGARVLRQLRRVAKFGTAADEPVALAQDLIDHIYEVYQRHENYRGGRYLPGYWSVSMHVAFGMLSGALPSGRRRGKSFTPGLTPAPDAGGELLDNIHAVAALDPLKMPNNIAFNVKLLPKPGTPHHQTLDHLCGYVGGYLDAGGMQWQFNVVSSETMRAAMDNPDDYRWLLVRISGYNAHFVELNRNMQLELIERMEYRTGF